MIELSGKFAELEKQKQAQLKKLSLNLPVGVFYGFNSANEPRLGFLLTNEPPKIDSTKLIKVVSTKERDNVHWLYFDLIDSQAKQAFCLLCESLICSISESKAATETQAVTAIQNRFHLWKKLFRKDTARMSEELAKGLLGELYFIEHYILPEKGAVAIEAWNGPNRLSKDFAFGDTWYEIKTTSASSTTVRIASIQQLSSNEIGHLVVVKVDAMGEHFNATSVSVNGLIETILSTNITEQIKELFFGKLVQYGYIDAPCTNTRYRIVSMAKYLVDGKFPRINDGDIMRKEIANISYDLVLAALERYKEA